MARKPAAPSPSGGVESTPPDTGEPAARGGRGGNGERFGPLAIARVGKEDGRALIIYSHEDHEKREELEEHERT